jgi:tetratricopeptide (TPR) repeat protein
MNTQAAPTLVEVHRETVVISTYAPQAPDRNPMFLEKRVYQGSSGRVYPLPFTDRIAEEPRPLAWEAVVIENQYVRVTVLPALGGRIHRAQDKTNGYDFIYHQEVIKPALVGLAGPWASGGIEFNWPQHHRPSTFMPADVAIESRADGAKTVWLSEHDPMARMKGMHGVRLHPGRSYIELVARVYNRTADTQTFLWWANVAARAHELYQSFFPPDTTFVADHAKRAISTYPLCDGRYYGVDYGSRARRGVPTSEAPSRYTPPRASGGTPAYRPNDLSWYANIPVPTSYMALGSQEDFAGGYDHRERAGIVHIANHHISPGKKQWTWGNHEFGYAWDRNLTDPDKNGEYRPYIELMGGVYTDNQPDFSFLHPGETRTWSQFWYPLRAIGPAQKANKDAAISFRVSRGIAQIGIAVTARLAEATVVLAERGGRVVGEWSQALAPDRPLLFETVVGRALQAEDFSVSLLSGAREAIIAHHPATAAHGEPPPPAAEPPPPPEVGSCDELYVIGLHLEQYRHATRQPEVYWREALRRDPGDSRCNLAMGRWHLRRGELAEAERSLRASISRLVSRNPNPYDGEAYYRLGTTLRLQALGDGFSARRLEDAYAAFYKATWNHAWQSASFHALAEIDCLRGDRNAALDHVERALRLNADNLRARDLKAIALRGMGRVTEADALLRETVRLDPLDWWARHLLGEEVACDTQVRIDLALEYAGVGLMREATGVLSAAARIESRPAPDGHAAPPVVLPDASLGTEPLVHYYLAWLSSLQREPEAERLHLAAASAASADYCFPSRIEEIAILRHALRSDPGSGRAPYLLGNLLYDKRRHREAIVLWEQAARLDPANAVAWRNLGIGYFNILRRPRAARNAYERAFAANRKDARLLYERDQLWKRLRVAPARRLAELRRHTPLVRSRDDLSLELCALLNRVGAPADALRILSSRRFQPWEGGEGMALRQHTLAHLALGRADLARGDAKAAARHFGKALSPPENLGEANHPLANQSDVRYWLGLALQRTGDPEGARAQWTQAAQFEGDFHSMSVQRFSEMTYFRALSLRCLGRKGEATRLLGDLLRFSRRLSATPAGIDYFATSLPSMLLFDDDMDRRQKTRALFLSAQAQIGLGRAAAARKLLRTVLVLDPSHPYAADPPP